MPGWLWLDSRAGWHYFDASVSLYGGQALPDTLDRPDRNSPICKECLWALLARRRQRQYAQALSRGQSSLAREGPGIERRAT